MSEVSQAAYDVLQERFRQQDAEGWSPEHDDQHEEGELASAAACYAWASTISDTTRQLCEAFPQAWSDLPVFRRLWQWSPVCWKPKDPRRNLVKAAALIIAEIERLDRKAGKEPRP